MNSLKTILLALPAALMLTGATHASTDAQIIERIQPIGQACITGEPCSAQEGAPQTASTSTSGARDGQAIYDQYCQMCHATGLAGAPKQDDKANWQARLDGHGSFDALLQSAISGIGAMPPKGTCSDCSDEELAAAVEVVSGLAP